MPVELLGRPADQWSVRWSVAPESPVRFDDVSLAGPRTVRIDTGPSLENVEFVLQPFGEVDSAWVVDAKGEASATLRFAICWNGEERAPGGEYCIRPVSEPSWAAGELRWRLALAESAQTRLFGLGPREEAAAENGAEVPVRVHVTSAPQDAVVWFGNGPVTDRHGDFAATPVDFDRIPVGAGEPRRLSLGDLHAPVTVALFHRTAGPALATLQAHELICEPTITAEPAAGESWAEFCSYRAPLTFTLDEQGGFAGLQRGPPMVNGFLTVPQVDRVLRRHTRGLRYCIEREYGSDVPIGWIMPNFTVDLQGRVSSASIVANTFRRRPVQDCILREVRRMRFDYPDGGMVVVNAPFISLGPP